MESILDLPDIVLEKIALKLEVLDLNNYRLACRRLNSLALPKGNLEKIAINLRRLNEYDLESVYVFLENISYGKFVTFKSVSLESYGCLMEQSTQGKLLSFAKNLSIFEGDIVLIDYLLTNCASIETLNLFCEPDIYDDDRFYRYFSYLTSFINLKDLQLNNLLERLPVTSINIICMNAVNLLKLGFSFIRFHCEGNIQCDYTEIGGKKEVVYIVDESTVRTWTFNQVGTEQFKIMLPSTISSVNMISSPSILWYKKRGSLDKLVYVNNYCSILTICPEIDHLFRHDVDNFSLYLRNKLMFERLRLGDSFSTKHYQSFTLAANYITSSVIDKMMSIVGVYSLTRVHLINHRCGKEYPNVAMDQCTDLDIMRLLIFYKNIDVLILESFDEITVDLIDLMSFQSLNIKLLQLVKCYSFTHETIQEKLQQAAVKFKIDIVNRCSHFIKSLHVLMYPQYYYYY